MEGAAAYVHISAQQCLPVLFVAAGMVSLTGWQSSSVALVAILMTGLDHCV